MNVSNNDKERAQAENDCLNYCTIKAMDELVKGNLKGAAVFVENAIRSQEELEEMQLSQEAADKFWLMHKQTEGHQQQVDFLFKGIKPISFAKRKDLDL